MPSQGVFTPMPNQIDDFTDRVGCLQNLYKDLISAHPCAQIFSNQLDVVGSAIGVFKWLHDNSMPVVRIQIYVETGTAL